MKEAEEKTEMQKVALNVTYIFVGLIAAYIIVQIMNSYFNLPDDNVYETLIENVIQGTTGVEIDLTPDSVQ